MAGEREIQNSYWISNAQHPKYIVEAFEIEIVLW